jgi:hypothetical protein
LFGGTGYDVQAWHHVMREALGDGACYKTTSWDSLKKGQASLVHYYIVNFFSDDRLWASKTISLAELPAAFEQRASELPQEEAALRNEKEHTSSNGRRHRRMVHGC